MVDSYATHTHTHTHTHTGTQTEQEPSLLQLTLLKSPSGKRVEIIKTIAPDWNKFGIYFDFDKTGQTLKCIAKEHPFNPIDCCTHMMREWLEGRGRQPATWATLIDLLKDAEMNDLAQQVEKIVPARTLQQGGTTCGKISEEEMGVEVEGDGKL